MGILDGLQQFVFRNFYWIDIQLLEGEDQGGKRAQNRGDWQARDRRSKKCRKSKKRPLSPPPCSCAALLQVASKPPPVPSVRSQLFAAWSSLSNVLSPAEHKASWVLS